MKIFLGLIHKKTTLDIAYCGEDYYKAIEETLEQSGPYPQKVFDLSKLDIESAKSIFDWLISLGESEKDAKHTVMEIVKAFVKES